jgi:hypothetical protein
MTNVPAEIGCQLSVSGFRFCIGCQFPASGVLSDIAVPMPLSILKLILHTEPTGNRKTTLSPAYPYIKKDGGYPLPTVHYPLKKNTALTGVHIYRTKRSSNLVFCLHSEGKNTCP